MKISQMIENLYDFALKYGDLDCGYVAYDDSISGEYHEIFYRPCMRYVNIHGEMFEDDDMFKESRLENEDMKDGLCLRKVCIIN